MLSLCNIYAPNNQAEQLEFLQELNNCLIDKSELTTLIVGDDWNCTSSKNNKIGGKLWKATNYRNLVLTTMDILDHSKGTTSKIAQVLLRITGSKSKIQNRLFFGRQKLDTIRQKE